MSEAIRQGDIPGVQLRRRQALAVSVEVAWPYLVEPVKLETWLCRQARTEAGAVEWTDPFHLDGQPIETVRTLETEPPRRLVGGLSQEGWTASTRLEFELTETGKGCELSVLHNGFEHLPLSISLTVWEAYRRRWRTALERLASATG